MSASVRSKALSGTSELRGVIEHLRYGVPLYSEQVDEIERVLQILQDNGWSGLIPADEAVKTLIRRRTLKGKSDARS